MDSSLVVRFLKENNNFIRDSDDRGASTSEEAKMPSLSSVNFSQILIGRCLPFSRFPVLSLSARSLARSEVRVNVISSPSSGHFNILAHHSDVILPTTDQNHGYFTRLLINGSNEIHSVKSFQSEIFQGIEIRTDQEAVRASSVAISLKLTNHNPFNSCVTVSVSGNISLGGVSSTEEFLPGRIGSDFYRNRIIC
jgi:hypothetical protein